MFYKSFVINNSSQIMLLGKVSCIEFYQVCDLYYDMMKRLGVSKMYGVSLHGTRETIRLHPIEVFHMLPSSC